MGCLKLEILEKYDNLKITFRAKNSVFLGDLDYYPFGMQMPGRSFNSSEYRFGFNGQEKDDEITGITGAHLEYKFREYDTRIARMWSIDPIASQYPMLTPYQHSSLSPIWMIELEGLEGHVPTSYYNSHALLGVEEARNLEAKQGKAAMAIAEVAVTAATMIANPPAGIALAVSLLSGVPVTPTSFMAAEATVAETVTEEVLMPMVKTTTTLEPQGLKILKKITSLERENTSLYKKSSELYNQKSKAAKEWGNLEDNANYQKLNSEYKQVNSRIKEVESEIKNLDKEYKEITKKETQQNNDDTQQ